MRSARFAFTFFLVLTAARAAAPSAPSELPGDRMLSDYFRRETARVNAATFADVKTLEDWTRQRATAREQFFEMMGLWPLPPKTDLQATVTGRVEHPEFFVDKLHYQSMPGLYVGASLYVPKNLTGKAPAILYVCGHSTFREGGVAYGAKVNYQHHGGWFARHGYVCLTIDTIQYGELEGLHHGTYREGMWWWNARGYTPGGVELWNSIRALDYLQSRPEVDGDRLGMTGRSGGGAYTWYTAAADERVKVAVPVAGITDLHNYVVDGCVRGHCDCMFIVNTYRWDYAKFAALVAPRPLLISNTDKDWIFPLDGVYRLHQDVARIYRLYGAADKLGLLITEGPHKDTQDLQVPAFRWFDRFLKGENPLISVPATKLLPPTQLKVFTTLPADQRTTSIHETFVPLAAPGVPASPAEWAKQSAGWLRSLREKSFRGWPDAPSATRPVCVAQESRGGMKLARWEYTSQEGVTLPLFVFAPGEPHKAKQVRLQVLDEQGWSQLVAALGQEWRLPPDPLAGAQSAAGSGQASSVERAGKSGSAAANATAANPTLMDFAALQRQVERGDFAVAYLPPRGVGPTAWSGDDKAKIHVKRRYMLLGQTLEGMRVWDIRRAVEALREPELFGRTPVQLAGERHQAVNALYAALFADGVSEVELIEPPASHRTGPDYLNVLRFLDVPQAVAMVAESRPVKFVRSNRDGWGWAIKSARQLGWPAGRLQW